MKSLSVLFISLLCISHSFAQNKADSAKIALLITKSKDAYAQVKTYADSGKVIQTIINNGRTSKTALVFKVVYTKAGGFNFDAYKEGQSNSLYTINRTDKTVKTWWGITDKEETPESISRAIAGASGATSGDCRIVPELLLPADFKGVSFFKALKHGVMAGTEKVAGKDCFIIKGDGTFGATSVWIAKSDFLIRKVETEKVINPADLEARIRKIAKELKKKDSVKYKGTIDASKTLAEANRRANLNNPFTVKSSYTLIPVIDHKISARLLKYRPNREVAL